jgi:hypothetical protein
MKRWLRRIVMAAPVGVLVMLSLAASAQQPQRGRFCLLIDTITSWNPVDAWSVVIGTSAGQNYRATFAAPCRHMKWSVLTRVEARLNAGRCLGTGDIMIFGRGGRRVDRTFVDEDRCIITSVEPIETKPPLPFPRPPR